MFNETEKVQVSKKAFSLIPSLFTALCDHMALVLAHVWILIPNEHAHRLK